MWKMTPTAPPWRNTTPEPGRAANASLPSPWAPASGLQLSQPSIHGGNGMAGEAGVYLHRLSGSPPPRRGRPAGSSSASASALKRFTAQALQDNPDSILAPRSSVSTTVMCPAKLAFLRPARSDRWAGKLLRDAHVGHPGRRASPQCGEIFQLDTGYSAARVSNGGRMSSCCTLCSGWVEQQTIPAAEPDKENTHCQG